MPTWTARTPRSCRWPPDTPVGIALDVPQGKLYVAEAKNAQIVRANLNGTNRQVLFSTSPESFPNGLALDPGAGKVYWSVPFPIRSGLTIPTPRKLGDYLLVTSFYNGPMMLGRRRSLRGSCRSGG